MSKRLGAVLLVACGALAFALLSAQPAGREEGYRANNLGVAYLEQYNYESSFGGRSRSTPGSSWRG
jgi:hypothetical protein